MSSHSQIAVDPPEIGPHSTDDDVMEAVFTRGDEALSFHMPSERLLGAGGESSLASQILKTVVSQHPITEPDRAARKTQQGVTGGAHPSLSFTQLAPHDSGVVHVVISDNPDDHRRVMSKAASVLSPHAQPQIHVIPDTSALPNKPDLRYPYI